MHIKYDVSSITNTYISQLHYTVSCILDSEDNSSLNKELEKILELTKQFQNNIKSEREKPK